MAIQLTIEDENYQKALKKRGIENLELIQIDPGLAEDLLTKI